MAGSNIAALKGRLADDLPGVLGLRHFDYSYVGKHHDAEREYGWLGERATGPMAAAAMAGGTRFTRQEDLSFQLVLTVRRPGEQTARTAEADVVELGRLVEEHLAGNWRQADDINGLLKVLITEFELESGVDDDGATSTLTYTVQLESHVR